MPENKGVLFGDKGIDRIFDNSKIKSVVKEFSAPIKFEDGIKETIEYYRNNKDMQEIDYTWDARIDNLIKRYYSSIKKKDYNRKKLTIKSYKNKLTIKNRIQYFIGKHEYLYEFLIVLKKIKNKIKR